ncbi:MAG TPA: hypothetical protein PKV66_00810 [Candidatus Pelethenecus sp.]|nr:hypothetical protein [Candidatus Pelethenecus sp.]
MFGRKKRKINIKGNLKDIKFPIFAEFVDKKKLELFEVRFGDSLYLDFYIKIEFEKIYICFRYKKYNKGISSIKEDYFNLESFDFTQKGYQEMIDYVNSEEFKKVIYNLRDGK